LATWLPAPPGSTKGLILETRDIDGDCGRLKESGVAVKGPFETPWGRQATLEDPDGNGIVLSEPVPGDA
jgi:predicted enzyme related to lactoylglutathione lyase